jgi:hypothetical protein
MVLVGARQRLVARKDKRLTGALSMTLTPNINSTQ